MKKSSRKRWGTDIDKVWGSKKTVVQMLAELQKMMPGNEFYRSLAQQAEKKGLSSLQTKIVVHHYAKRLKV